MIQGTFGVFENEELVAGDEASRRRAREDLHRRRQQRFVETSNWRRIDRDDLRIAGHTIEDVRTGEKFKRYRGELLDAANVPVTAWAVTPDGPLLLEPMR